jgi:hypothetical protein
MSLPCCGSDKAAAAAAVATFYRLAEALFIVIIMGLQAFVIWRQSAPLASRCSAVRCRVTSLGTRITTRRTTARRAERPAGPAARRRGAAAAMAVARPHGHPRSHWRPGGSAMAGSRVIWVASASRAVFASITRAVLASISRARINRRPSHLED